jgi:hypothetical protein
MGGVVDWSTNLDTVKPLVTGRLGGRRSCPVTRGFRMGGPPLNDEHLRTCMRVTSEPLLA